MKNPVQPIQVKDMDFLQPESADTRPPEDILKWYSPLSSLEMVMGSRLETTMKRRFSLGEVGASDDDMAGDVGAQSVLGGNEVVVGAGRRVITRSEGI